MNWLREHYCFLRSLRNDDGDDYATKTSLKKLICAASNLGPVYIEWGTPVYVNRVLIGLIPSRLIRQMLTIFFGVEF